MKPLGWCFIALVLAIAGCESTPHYNRTKVVNLAPAKPKKPYGSVALIEAPEAIARPYERIAIMSVQGSPGEESAFIKAFLYRAADLGADAVIFHREGVTSRLVGGGTYTTPNGVARAPIRTKVRGVYRGEVIAYK